MKELTRVQTSKLAGGDRCGRLLARSDKLAAKGRDGASLRVYAKYIAAGCKPKH